MKKKIIFTGPKKVINISLPYMGNNSLKIRTKLTKITKSYFCACKIQVTFNAGSRLSNFLNFKDSIALNARSLILYQFACHRCNSACVGKTKRHYLVRMFEHLGISLATGNKYTYNPKYRNNTTVLNHINCNNCNATVDNFRII